MMSFLIHWRKASAILVLFKFELNIYMFEVNFKFKSYTGNCLLISGEKVLWTFKYFIKFHLYKYLNLSCF